MTANPLPKAVLAQHTLVLGKTRSGKSSTMRVMVECLLNDKRPVCIIDPKGDWWGIKSSSNGKKAGYDVVIFGGSHADVPINAQSGKVVAELVATGNRPALIDLGGWMVGERTRFFIDFASTLFTKTHGHRWLVIDECHNFAPQGKVQDPQAGMSLHWANRLASEGAGKGVVLISASQRPQKVHKDYVTSHETLIAKRVIHPLDRDAMKEWIDGCGDPAKGKAVLDTLAGLQRSEGWVWSPEIDFGPKLVAFPMFNTYDSFAVQTGKAGRKLKGWASVDLDAVKERLAAVIEENKAKDPVELRKQLIERDRKIAILELQAAAKSTTAVAAAKPDKDAIAAAEQRGFEHAQKKLTASMERELRKRLKDALGLLRGYTKKFVEQLDGELEAVNLREAKAEPVSFTLAPQQYRPTAQTATKLVPVRQPASPTVDGDNRPLGAERKPLAALASVYPAGMTEAQWAVAAVLKRTGGTWSTYLSRLRTSGRVVEEAGLWFVTDQGIADLGVNIEPTPAPGPALVNFWTRKIASIGPMLNRLAEIYPSWTTREQLAADLNLTAGAGTFSTYLSRLRSPGLIEEDRDGNVRAAPQLMERTT